MKEIKPPKQPDFSDRNPLIFLAGSIEMGTAPDWQKDLVNRLSDQNLTILNPRRDNWDSTWKQSIKNNQFKGQVEWEITGIENADYVVFYFDPSTKAPITLYELGLAIGLGKYVFVCCPEGFWRKGNIEVYCKRKSITLYSNLDQLVKDLKKEINKQ